MPSFICGTHKTTMSLLCKSLTSNSGEMTLVGSDSVTKPHLDSGSTSSAVWAHACKLDRAEGPTSVSYISSISPPAANSQVIFRDTKPHGHWHYEYDSVKDVGRFKIMFNCRGDEGLLRKHELVSIPKTSCYWLVHSQNQIVMMPCEPESD